MSMECSYCWSGPCTQHCRFKGDEKRVIDRLVKLQFEDEIKRKEGHLASVRMTLEHAFGDALDEASQGSPPNERETALLRAVAVVVARYTE